MRTRNFLAGLISIWSSLGVLIFAILNKDGMGVILSLILWIAGGTLISGYLRYFRTYVKKKNKN